MRRLGDARATGHPQGQNGVGAQVVAAARLVEGLFGGPGFGLQHFAIRRFAQTSWVICSLSSTKSKSSVIGWCAANLLFRTRNRSSIMYCVRLSRSPCEVEKELCKLEGTWRKIVRFPKDSSPWKDFCAGNFRNLSESSRNIRNGRETIFETFGSCGHGASLPLAHTPAPHSSQIFFAH